MNTIMGSFTFGLLFILTLISINAKGIELEINSPRNLTGQIRSLRNAKGGQTPEIPDGYNFTRGNYTYKVCREPKKWNDARNACVYSRGHLLVLDSEHQAQYIREEMQRAQVSEVWLGIHDLYSNREFVTIQDVPLPMTGWVTWIPNNPDNLGGNQHCVRLMEGGMDDYECDRVQSFICRYECSVNHKGSARLE